MKASLNLLRPRLTAGGQVLVYCTSSSDQQRVTYSRLTLDYVTDHVLDVINVAGEPHVSPDGRTVVTVDRRTNTLSVYNVGDSGEANIVSRLFTRFCLIRHADSMM